jgi:hypothetical protein
MVGITQIEARNALFPELVGAEPNPRRLFAGLTPESNTKVPSFLHPMRYATSGPGPSSKSANAAVDYELVASSGARFSLEPVVIRLAARLEQGFAQG